MRMVISPLVTFFGFSSSTGRWRTRDHRQLFRYFLGSHLRTLLLSSLQACGMAQVSFSLTGYWKPENMRILKVRMCGSAGINVEMEVKDPVCGRPGRDYAGNIYRVPEVQ